MISENQDSDDDELDRDESDDALLKAEHEDDAYDGDDDYGGEAPYEDDFDDDDSYEEDEYEQEVLGPSKKRRRMFCSFCNRMETHKLDRRKSFWKSYVTGLTFGINRLFGPFQCVCCGQMRWKFKLKRKKKV